MLALLTFQPTKHAMAFHAQHSKAVRGFSSKVGTKMVASPSCTGFIKTLISRTPSRMQHSVFLQTGFPSYSTSPPSLSFNVIRLFSSASFYEEKKEEYNSMTVAELRDLLRQRGMAVSGIKAELIERLVMGGEHSSPQDAESSLENVKKEKKNRRNLPRNLVFLKEGEGDDDDFDDDDFDDDDFDDDDDGREDGDRNHERNKGKKSATTFKDEFQGTRVFVQGLPTEATWKDVRRELFIDYFSDSQNTVFSLVTLFFYEYLQMSHSTFFHECIIFAIFCARLAQLKEHFKIAGEVIFASVSIDPKTGRSKQCGIVQYETPEMAQAAIRDMRNHPLNGEKLFVRKDVQENRQGGNGQVESRRMRGNKENNWHDEKGLNHKVSLPSEWRRADDEEDGGEVGHALSEEKLNEVVSLIKKRDLERRKKNYKMSDALREELKEEYDVHVDDNLKVWWIKPHKGGVPGLVSDIKGDGRWGKQRPWRQIPTDPESDAFVDSNLVNKLLQKRDKARRMKDFITADALLREVYESPEGGLGLRVDDEGRTWRIWTEKPPPKKNETPGGYEELTPSEMCIQIVKENEPDKVDEMGSLLKKFPGREWSIFKRLKQRYFSS